VNQEQHQQTVQQWWRLADEATPEPGWTRLYHDKDTHMKIEELIPSKYLKQSDVDGERVVTVEALRKTNVAREDEAPEYKYVIKFREFERPMVLNSTNIKRLGKALGGDTDDWIGGSVMLYVDPDVEYGGEVKGGLRVRALAKHGTKANRSVDDVDSVNRKFKEAEDDIPF
jgi:hypothetical protein